VSGAGALPVEAAIPSLLAALRNGRGAVLEAPPGAGKTTRVPLALLDEPWAAGRIVMLEPRRLAARAAAARMAATLGEPVGRRVGFRIRGETVVSGATRVEVVTEGVLTRMLQSDPSLDGVAAVIFDEIHERSLNADLGLALCLESRAALRPDLRLLAMSATLDAGPLAALMDAPRIVSAGVAWPVETRWADRPLPGTPREAAAAVAEAALAALAAAPGNALAFLPGQGEIARVAAALSGRLPPDVEAVALYGDLPADRQRAALDPPARGRRLTLATAIAETSLTVPGVRIVVDAGRARRARFDPGSGMTRLVTERASRAEADQRRGRAGREGPGLCLRLWTRGEEGAMAPFAPPEIATADLAPLALELAAWGAADPAALPFLDPPPAAAFAEARALLAELGALGPDGRITARGRAMSATPVHPRLARMILDAGDAAPTARALAALLTERDPLRTPGGDAGADMALRLEALADPACFARARGHAVDRAALARVAETAARLGPRGRVDPSAAGRLLALAYPDRVAQRRPGVAPRWLLSGGKGATMAPGDALAGAPLLAAADLDGDPREARIRRAAPLTRAEAEAACAPMTAEARVCAWSRRDRAVTARVERRLGAVVLESRPLDAAPDELAAAMADGVRDLGLGALPWDGAAASLRARVGWLRGRGGGDWPDWSDEALLATLEDWLGPWLSGLRRAEDLARVDLAGALRAALGREGLARLDREAPATLATPAGPEVAVDYARDRPTAQARAQWLYGLDRHPTAGGAPVLLELLSPAGRPIAATTDLPGFWRGGWADARRDMRGRYPRHDWPERPWEAAPTTRAKPRSG
jgi:ATP-dependent helicase HrpB